MIIQYTTCFFVVGAAIIQALLSTFISIMCALPCVYFFNRFHFIGKRFFLYLVPLLCIMPSKIMALGISSLSDLDGMLAIIWGHCALNIPLAFFVIHTASQIMNPHWQLIAQELGASRWHAYKDIDFPFLRPTIFSSAIIIFLLCFTSFSLPQILGTADYHMTPDILLYQTYTGQDYWLASIYFILRLLVLLPICFLSFKHYGGWLEHAMHEKNYESYKIKKHGVWWMALLLLVGILVLGPIIAALMHTCDSKVIAFWCSIVWCGIDTTLHMPVYRVIANSVLLACASGLGSVLVGYVLCKSILWARSTIVKNFISLITGAVFLLGSVGCGILFLWIAHSSFFSTCCAAILCHIVLNYPFAYRMIKAHYGSWQPEWDLSAQSFGATAIDRWKTLELPFLRASFAKAFCISFGLSLTEVGAGSVFGDSSGITIPMAIRIYREHGMQEGVIGLTIILLMIVFALGLGMRSSLAKH